MVSYREDGKKGLVKSAISSNTNRDQYKASARDLNFSDRRNYFYEFPKLLLKDKALFFSINFVLQFLP